VAGLAATATAYIAPNVKVGTSLLGIVYVLGQIWSMVHLAAIGDGLFVITKIIVALITVLVFYTAYQDGL